MTDPRDRLLNRSPGRGARLLRVVLSVSRMAVLILAAGLLTSGHGGADVSAQSATQPATAPAVPAGAIHPDVIAALKSLKSTPSPTGRLKIYEVLAEKGDARIIPALNAFLGGQLKLQDDRLLLYGPAREVVEDGQTARYFPLFDALTGDAVVGPDGKPVVEKINLGNAMRAPIGDTQKKPVRNLLAALSLLHPDAEKRRESIRDAGSRSARVFPDPDDEIRIRRAMQEVADLLQQSQAAATTRPATMPTDADPKAALLAAVQSALTDKPATLLASTPSQATVDAVAAALTPVKQANASLGEVPSTLPTTEARLRVALATLETEISTYKGRLDALKTNYEELPNFAEALKRQLNADPKGEFAGPLTEAVALMDAVLGDRPAQLAAVKSLGDIGTARAENLLGKLKAGADRIGDAEFAAAVAPSLDAAESYQSRIKFVQNTFAGLSLGSILVLLALGLSIVFGLMGVINMAHGEFMMVGAFTTFVVASAFKTYLPDHYNWFPLAAIPAAFLVSGVVGLIAEALIIRHLYGRPLDTLLATWGIGLILIWAARKKFGDSLSVSAPTWMQGGWEVAPDLVFALNRLYILLYCVFCITIVYFMVNRTKLGLLLRATTQNRPMAASLGVPTRLIDAMTFAFGCGLAGLAGVAVPLYNKINPSIGQEYIVECFMVVVVGGVGKLAGAIVAGFGLGFVGKYFESFLGSMPTLSSGASVYGKVLVLLLVVAFLQRRPSGLFPQKGRLADA